MVPLQLPGGPELLVIGMIFLLFVVLLVAVLGAVGYLFLRGRSDRGVEERLDRVEHDVERLAAQVERRQDENGGDE